MRSHGAACVACNSRIEPMSESILQNCAQRLRALVRKEFNPIRRDRRLAISLVVPPTLQLLLFGFALDASVKDLRLGVVDESRTPESRELISVLTQNPTFHLEASYASAAALD